jgi:transcriptional regulator with XRE-family HTH domain
MNYHIRDRPDTFRIFGRMDNSLLSVVAKIKSLRKEKGLTLQALADKTGYTKAFMSKIENRRVSPSLQSLFKIVKALDTSMDDFFKEIFQENEPEEKRYIYLPKNKYEKLVREDSQGFNYSLVYSTEIVKNHLDVVFLELEQVSSREELTETDGFELFIVVKGNILMQMENDFIDLKEGDAIYHDGRVPHKPVNKHNGASLCLVLYFLSTGQ